MFNSPYDTTVCQAHSLSQIQQAVLRAKSNGDLPWTGDVIQNLSAWQIRALVGGDVATTGIPPFAHPLTVSDPLYKEDFLVIDLRPFVKVKPGEGAVKSKIQTTDIPGYVEGSSDATLLVRRALLQLVWMKDDPHDLFTVSMVPMIVFCSWIAETITQKLGLDPKAQMQIMGIVGFYYVSLFEEETTWNDQDRLRIAKLVSQATRISVNDLLAVNGEIPYLGTLAALVDYIKECKISSRLDELSVPFILTLFTGAWYGFQAKEVAAISLEHPPTFYALVIAAITDRTYRNSILFRYVDRTNKARAHELMMRAVRALLEKWGSNE